MATIFLVMIGVALGGLLIAFGTGLSAFGALDPERLDAHRNLAFACAIAVVFVHSLVFVYLIGTGRAIKDAVREFEVDGELYEEHIGYKWRAAPWALSCTVVTLATAVMGALVQGTGFWSWFHPLFAVLALLCNLFGLPAEYRAIRDNGGLLDRVARATAEKNRKQLEQGLDPAPPASPLSGAGWSLVLGLSAWLPWVYMRFVMGRSTLAWWPFAVASLVLLLPFLRAALGRPRS